MAADLDPLSGDVADLIDYRRIPTGMVHKPGPRPGRAYIEITCRVIPPTAEQERVWRQLESDLARVGVLGSFHEEPARTRWIDRNRQVVNRAVLLLAAGVWLAVAAAWLVTVALAIATSR